MAELVQAAKKDMVTQIITLYKRGEHLSMHKISNPALVQTSPVILHSSLSSTRCFNLQTVTQLWSRCEKAGT